MLIKDWMATNVLSVDESTSVMRATRIMKENNVRRLPVLSQGKLTGIITDRDLKDASPSKSTSLDIHEMYYILSEMKVKDAMTPNPICMSADESMEKAAVVILKNKISGLVVVDESGHLAGLLSETDILRSFIHSTGIKNGTYLHVFVLPDEAGLISKVIAIFRDHQARVISILTSFDEEDAQGKKTVSIRTDINEDKVAALHKELGKNFEIIFHGRDDLTDLPTKAP